MTGLRIRNVIFAGVAAAAMLAFVAHLDTATLSSDDEAQLQQQLAQQEMLQAQQQAEQQNEAAQQQALQAELQGQQVEQQANNP